MFVKGYFSKGIFSMFEENVDIKAEVISQIEAGNCVSEDIFDEIEEQYGEFNEVIDFVKYLSVDENSIRLDRDSDDDYYVAFVVNCEFDMERFAIDNGLVKRMDLDERDEI